MTKKIDKTLVTIMAIVKKDAWTDVVKFEGIRITKDIAVEVPCSIKENERQAQHLDFSS